MNVEAVTSTFSPGDYVFLQGEKIPDYYKVVSGRFAKVRSNLSANSVGVKKMLASAELLNIVSHQELIGEIEALMGYPLPFSVFALDESEVFSVPASKPMEMKDTFFQNPKIGVKTCISFAKYLRQFFSYFARVSREEVSIDSFCKGTARDYMAVVNELETLTMNRKCVELDTAKAHAAYSLAKEICNQATFQEKGSSVACGVVPINGSDIKIQRFKAGTPICKKGTTGDSLFILTEGVAEVLTEGNNPNIRIDKPGSVVGEIAVFLNLDGNTNDTKRTADVVCLTDLSAIVLKLDQIESFFVKQPDIMTRILIEMVSRSEITRSMCLATEKRLSSTLYGKLGVILEGLNNLAHNLSKSKDNVSFARPLTFCAQRARAVFDRFKESLQLLEEKNRIRT